MYTYVLVFKWLCLCAYVSWSLWRLRKKHHIPRSWSCRLLWTTPQWLLGIELWSFGRTARAFKCWAISTAFRTLRNCLLLFICMVCFCVHMCHDVWGPKGSHGGLVPSFNFTCVWGSNLGCQLTRQALYPPSVSLAPIRLALSCVILR